MGKHSSRKRTLGSGTRRFFVWPSRRSRAPREIRSIPRAARLRGARPLLRERVSDPAERRRGALEAAPERLKAERERRRRRARRVALVTIATAAALVVAAAVGLFFWAKGLERTMQQTVYKKEKLDVRLEKAAPSEPFNVLMLGYDRRPKETVYRADTIILARIDPRSKQVWLVSIPRDAKVEIPGFGTHKINQAYALGREQLAIETVEQLTGVKINHFVGINFRGFQRAVDAMGGVWVDVDVEINDPQADATRGKTASHIAPGYQLLDGAHALTFVRTRHTFADQDFGRMRNQQKFFLALADQMAERVPVSRLPRIVTAVAPFISTDMSLVEMVRTAQALHRAGSKRIHTATLTGEWRSPYVVLDEAAKTAILEKFKAGVPFEEPRSTQATATAAAGAPARPLSPRAITVTVRNGAGISGCARQAASVLKARAFKVTEVGNAAQFVYDRTLVVYRTDRAAAELVARALPPGTKLVESRGMYRFDSDVLVVIGKDWDVAKVPVAPIITE